MFTVRAGEFVVNKQFRTRKEAEDWASWNYKGRGGWHIAPLVSTDANIDILIRLEQADAEPGKVDSWRDLVGDAADEIKKLRDKLATLSPIPQ